ncbi:DUF11 domain-containing protein [Deinococcus sp. RM]|uniref:DUF11 domain-containing protein n=1 Tax=Deinococcus sp. RM TaxID=2316359 RepID=UPI000E687826|nr:DUF11 domain-containing protein [Deinococcus sp. RM]RIY15593.1 DUF11 domain-containing protein [Deinococcus sp. RM]
MHILTTLRRLLPLAALSSLSLAAATTCTPSSPWTESFNSNAAQGSVLSHAYVTDVNTVTNTAGKYTLWNQIDRTGNGGYALYLNVANFEGKSGALLTTPRVLFQQVVNVPTGSRLTYQNYARTHATTPSQLRYEFVDTATGALLASMNGSVLTTGYTLQTVPAFSAPGSQVTVKVLTLKDGVSGDANVLKLDDLKLSCAPQPQLTLTKGSNGPWTVNQSGAAYTLTVTNSGSAATSGSVTVTDRLPTGIGAPASFTPATGWTCTTSAGLVTCTGTPNLTVGATATLSVPVTVAAEAAGTVTNRASVGGGGDPDPTPDPGSCTGTGGQCAVNTTTVTTTAPVCSKVYALAVAPGGTNLNGVTINELDVTTNAVGTQIAALSGTGSAITSATLGVSPDSKRFFVAADGSNRLWVYDTTLRGWYGGGTFTGVSGRLVRMAVTAGGTGYAMDSGGNIWSFATGSGSGYAVTSLGALTSTSSGAPSFKDNGDFFADSSGKLYMISAVTGSNAIDLWLVTPSGGSASAEYLGNFSSPAQDSQFNGIAAAPGGIYARDNLGRLVKLDLANVTYTPVGTATLGSTDLASCTYPVLAPSLNAVKSVTKVAGTGGDKVQPGDTLEYRVVIRNGGTLPAGGVTFTDTLPAGTTYVPGSARVNGATSTVTNGAGTSLGGAAYPFAQLVGICSGPTTACTTQVLKIDSTPAALDNEAVVTFRVTVNAPASYPASVRNTALVRYAGGPNGGVPSNEVVTPVFEPARLTVTKTVQNLTRGGPVGTSSSGNPGDVLEYCIATTNVGGLNATNISFSDMVPANTAFQVGGFAAGQDIRVATPTGTAYYTAAADGDAGLLSGGKVTVQGGSFVLAPTQTVTICFRASIQ